MAKKASMLIMGIIFIFVLFTMTIYITQTIDKIDSDDFAGDDAMALQDLETASGKQRLFLELQGEKILDNIETEFREYLLLSRGNNGFVSFDSYEDLELFGYKWLIPKFNFEMKEAITKHNGLIGKDEDIWPKYFNNPNINRSLYAKDGKVYAIALAPQEVHKTLGSKNNYYYWPHLTMEDDFFTNLREPFDAKFIFERCYSLRDDVSSCLEEIRTRYPDLNVKAEIVKGSLLPENAIEDSLIIDETGSLIVKVQGSNVITYMFSSDLGKNWVVDEDNNVLVNDPTLYDKYLSDGTFEKYTLPDNEEFVNFYFDIYSFILT